jgi:hypothetical protein
VVTGTLNLNDGLGGGARRDPLTGNFYMSVYFQ